MRSRIILVAIAVLLATTVDAVAQQRDSHWGVGGSFVPLWKVLPELAVLWDANKEDIDYNGSEVRLGIVRGSDLGGDWGVSWVRKKVKEGSVIDRSSLAMFAAGDTNRIGSLYTTKDVSIVGVEVHKFTPFVTIKKRVQIGLSYAGGIASFKGRMTERRFDLNFGPAPGFVITQTETVSEVEAKDIFQVKYVPLGRVEAAVAVRVAPGLKLRASGGFNFPGTQVFGVTVNYLIGAK